MLRAPHSALALLALALTLVLAPCAAAQPDSASRRGFWIGLAAGAGSASGTCGGCIDERTRSGTAVAATAGGGVDERLVIAIEPSVWISGRGAVTQSQENEIQRGDLTVVGYLYPRPTRGTFVKVGAGYGGYWSTVDTPLRNASGVAGVNGAGHDWAASRTLVLRASLTAHLAWLGPVSEQDASGATRQIAPHATQRFLALEIAALVHGVK